MITITCNDNVYTCDFTHDETIICNDDAVAKCVINFIKSEEISPDDYMHIIAAHDCINTLNNFKTLNNKYVDHVMSICHTLDVEELRNIFTAI